MSINLDEGTSAPVGVTAVAVPTALRKSDHAKPTDIEEELDSDTDQEDDGDYSEGMEVEAFKAGTHTDAGGHTETWSAADLQNIAAKYNEKKAIQPAPVVLGHPMDSSPAYGWVTGARAVGDSLYLTLGELNPDFVQALKNGSYKTRSISLYEDGTIRHLGFLGGSQPAIKGLKPFSFVEDANTKTYTFSEGVKIMAQDNSLEDLKKENSFFKKLFSMFKVEVPSVADFAEGDGVAKLTPQAEKEQGAPILETPAEDAGEKPGTEHEEQVAKETTGEPVKPEDAKIEISKKAQADVKDEANAMAAELTTLKAEFAALKSQYDSLVATTTKEAVETSNRAFCETLVNEGRLRPCDVEIELENINARAYTDSVRSFSEGEVASVVSYKEHLKSMPKIVEFGEFATASDLPAKDALVGVPAVDSFIEDGIKDKMKLNPNISYADALRTVYEEAGTKFGTSVMCEYNRMFK